MDNLYGAGIEQATIALSQRHSLYPFMVRIGLDGEISTAMMDPSPTNGADVAAAHWEVLRMTSKDYRAVAIVLDVFVRAENTDAVSILSEHRDGLTLALTTPYVRKGLRKKLVIGQTSVSPGEKNVWAE
jgi:hypothetical protein